MEETPPNKANFERVGSWLFGKAKHLEKVIKDIFNFKAKARYEKMHERHFDEVEANELVHGISFQSPMTQTLKNSQLNERYSRTTVMAPCGGFEPNREFRLKYAGS